MRRLQEDSHEPFFSRELSPEEVLVHFPDALRNLRSGLATRTAHYNDVSLTSLARSIDWWVDGDGDLIGKSFHFGMLGPGWTPGDNEDVVMLWDTENKRWVEHQFGIGEVHIDRDIAREEPHTGGFEPIPGDETGMDVQGPAELTIEEVRLVVRGILRELLAI